MELNKGDNTVASIPTPDSGGTAGYFKNQGSGPPWTVIKADFLNGIAAEFKNVIEAAGLTLDGADLTQLLQAIGGALGVKSSATTTGVVTTQHRRAVLASYLGTASGFSSAVAASQNSAASGDQSAAVASLSSTASGTTSAVVGSVASTASGESAIVAASTSSLASGTRSAAIACDTCIANGFEAAAIASGDGTVTGSSALMLASVASHANGPRAVVINGVNVEVATPGMIGGGDNSGAADITKNGTDQGLKWYLTKEGYIVAARLTSSGTFTADGAVKAAGLKSGINQGAALAEAGELWVDTSADNAVKRGV